MVFKKGIVLDGFIRINVQPLSVNEAWKGRRIKTDKYKAYESLVQLLLPSFDIPIGLLTISFEFGFSNTQSDADNPVKLFMDILQKKYGFNDSRVYEINIRKKIVTKGMEYVKFTILPFKQELISLN